MEELFREILVPVPPSTETVVNSEEQVLLKEEEGEKVKATQEGNEMDVTLTLDDSSSSSNVDWANEIEMQRLLDSLQQHTAAASAQDFAGVDLGLGLLSWNEVENSVDVF